VSTEGIEFLFVVVVVCAVFAVCYLRYRSDRRKRGSAEFRLAESKASPRPPDARKKRL